MSSGPARLAADSACGSAQRLAWLVHARETEAYAISQREREKVEGLFAHLKRILRRDRLRLRRPDGARDEFFLAAAAQNLMKLATLLPNGPQIRPA